MERNQALRDHIGPKCELYEHVMPKRLYKELHGSSKRGNCVSMLVDEDGHYHDLPENLVASWLYESDKHGYNSGECPDCRREMGRSRHQLLRDSGGSVRPALPAA